MEVVYWVPVSVTSQLNVVRLPVFDAAVNVRVAWVDCPAGRTVLCRFHVRVSEDLALAGFQLLICLVIHQSVPSLKSPLKIVVDAAR
jgi:hypothetical protein